MARAYSPNNTEANAVRTRKANNRKADELRAAGWTCTPPPGDCPNGHGPMAPDNNGLLVCGRCGHFPYEARDTTTPKAK